MSVSEFEKEFSLEVRKGESTRICAKYPERVPIIMDVSKELEIEKRKYLAPKSLTMAEFQMTFRKYIKGDPNKAIYVFIMPQNGGSILLVPTMKIEEAYNKYRKSDGFLYMKINCESTFG